MTPEQRSRLRGDVRDPKLWHSVATSDSFDESYFAARSARREGSLADSFARRESLRGEFQDDRLVRLGITEGRPGQRTPTLETLMAFRDVKTDRSASREQYFKDLRARIPNGKKLSDGEIQAIVAYRTQVLDAEMSHALVDDWGPNLDGAPCGAFMGADLVRANVENELRVMRATAGKTGVKEVMAASREAQDRATREFFDPLRSALEEAFAAVHPDLAAVALGEDVRGRKPVDSTPIGEEKFKQGVQKFVEVARQQHRPDWVGRARLGLVTENGHPIVDPEGRMGMGLEMEKALRQALRDVRTETGERRWSDADLNLLGLPFLMTLPQTPGGKGVFKVFVVGPKQSFGDLSKTLTEAFMKAQGSQPGLKDFEFQVQTFRNFPQ